MVKILSKSLEDLEKELAEVEPTVEGEVSKRKLLASIIFGYLFWMIIYLLIYIYNNPGAYGDFGDIGNVLMIVVKEVPALGYIVIDNILWGQYVYGFELILPAIIAGVLSGILSKKPTNGILVGAIIWFIGVLLSLIVSSFTLSFTSSIFLTALLNILDNSLFVDPLVLALFGGLGGLLGKRV